MSRKIISKIFKINNYNSLEDIENQILSKQFNAEVVLTKKDLENNITLSGDNAYYYYTWQNTSEITDLNREVYQEIEDEEIEDEDIDKEKHLELENVKYIQTRANIEFGKRDKRDDHGNYLPREERTNSIQIDVYFYLQNEIIYCVICSSNMVYIRRIQKLIGVDNITSDAPSLRLPTDFFSWLFYQYEEENGDLNGHIELKNISGFIGNITDEHNVFEGQSDQTSELIITKAFISNGEMLKDITARILNKDIQITFGISSTLDTMIYPRTSTIHKLFDSEISRNFYVIYLYGFLIPDLKRIYSAVKDEFLNTNSPIFSKKIGIDVIKSLIQKNNISLDEIHNLYATDEQ